MTNSSQSPHGNSRRTLNRVKVAPRPHRAVFDDAVDAIINTFDKVDAGTRLIDKAGASQLRALQVALKDLPEPITETMWEEQYRGSVAERLDAARVGDQPRYSSPQSRDVIVNMIKVSTMGLTLSSIDESYLPAANAKSLKKYAAQVRPRLQHEIDPQTGRARLRSIAKKPKTENALSHGASYWLIGCEDMQAGLDGANTVLASSSDLDGLRHAAAKFRSHYSSFYYCRSAMEPLPLSPEAKPTEVKKRARQQPKWVAPKVGWERSVHDAAISLA